jgi:plasmid stabilization system protein ParE
MNYTVEWLPEAEAQLTTAWLASADRNAVTAAARRVDLDLAKDPFAVGESREENVRIGFEFPLRYLYRVHAGRAQVQVFSLSLYAKRPN